MNIINQSIRGVPIALGIGQVIKMGNIVFNMYVEPQYSILIDSTQPQVQILTGINLQFIGQD